MSAAQVINSLMALKAVTPSQFLGWPTPPSRSADVYRTAPSDVLKRGQAFFDEVYGKAAGRVMNDMDHCGIQDLGLLARLAYSYVLSNIDILSEVETSVIMVASLIPQDVSLRSDRGRPIASCKPVTTLSGEPSTQRPSQRRDELWCHGGGNEGSSVRRHQDMRGCRNADAQQRRSGWLGLEKRDRERMI
jgi:hypothetical protein